MLGSFRAEPSLGWILLVNEAVEVLRVGALGVHDEHRAFVPNDHPSRELGEALSFGILHQMTLLSSVEAVHMAF